MMTIVLKNWLKDEWVKNNHPKYQKYFDEWLKNLTFNQIMGFDKMRQSFYLKKQ